MRILSLFLLTLVLGGCSSAGVSDLQTSRNRASVAPSVILIDRFSFNRGTLMLGERTTAQKQALGREIVFNLAKQTSREVKRSAAPSVVLAPGRIPPAGSWLVTGEILKVDQGSRALRAGVGLGMGGTTFQTRVRVFAVGAQQSTQILSFRTTGRSGLEPGVALGVATGGVSLVGTSAGLATGSLAGVNSDIERTAFETAAVLSSYLASNGLLDSARRVEVPRMTGHVPTSVNTRRMIPGPIRDHVDF